MHNVLHSFSVVLIFYFIHNPTKFHINNEIDCFGATGLHIELDKPLTAGTKFELEIAYNTTIQGTAIQWLEPR